MANPTECDLEAHFREELFKRSKGKKSILLPKEQYNKIIADLTAIDKSGKKTPHEYYLLKKYEVLKCGDVFKLIRRGNANEDPIYFATLKDTFDIIKRAHIATGHGGRDKMEKELTKKYANITHDAISIYKWIWHRMPTSPFAALFGSDAKVGLTTSALPHDVIHRLQSEDDLLSVSTDETTLVEPSAVEPPAVEPPAVEPPATEPLTADPPAVDLISVEPPAVEPPATEPQATEPPTVEQSAFEPTSPLSVRQNSIISQRKRACEAQLSQAERMVKRSRRIMDRGNAEERPYEASLGRRVLTDTAAENDILTSTET
ncbi:hypothetical protein Pcinc_031073 [Petrolisthes cinctipes]|uniref:Integrase zinc-binding domain-containing protein n=1 Tax=Petrolisthes cinctipes TaxID=88211 RepID=A0AAE1EXE5_PETCI|nr:hypothetical protein Pcinc_031073 [Petrolisthes cinctipes]